MSQEIDELKELVRRNTALAQETREMVDSMRRSQRRQRLFQLLWWLTVLGVTGAVYYYVIGPYLTQILHLYQSIQSGAEGAQGFQEQFKEFLQRFNSTDTAQ